MKKIFIVIVTLPLFYTPIFAQTVNQMQIVGPQITLGMDVPEPNYAATIHHVGNMPHTLTVLNKSVSSGFRQALTAFTYTGSGDAVAVRAQAWGTVANTGKAYGVFANAGNSTSGYNYALFGMLSGTQNGAAVFGTSISGGYGISVPARFAGYFVGLTYVSERLGVGTTAPSYTLDVAGTIRCTVLTQTSDLRTKTNIADLGEKMDYVKQLRAVKYRLNTDDTEQMMQSKALPDTAKNVTDMRKYLGLEEKRDTDRDHIGFIAQEFKTVFPELVYEDEKGMLSIDYLSLIPILVETIQELNKRLEAVENKKDNGNVKAKQ